MHLKSFIGATVRVTALASVILLCLLTIVLVRGLTWRQNIRAVVVDVILAANQSGVVPGVVPNGLACLQGFTTDQIESIDYSNPYSIIVNTNSTIFYAFEFSSSESSKPYSFDRVEKRRWIDGKEGGLYDKVDETEDP